MVGIWAASAVSWYRARRPRLGEVLDDRSNNFDLIRLCAAALVIYGHSFFEAPDDPTPDRVQALLGGAEYSGSIAVYAFFLISGLLITASMEKHRSALAFVTLRAARIWPGFVVCAGLLIFAVVPLTSGIVPWEPAWRRAAASCFGADALFFVRDVCGALPGAFPRTPVPNAFGFSWWTLPAEVHCYAMVLGLGLVLRSRFSATPRQAARFVVATLALLAAYLAAVRHPPVDSAPFHAEFTVMGGYATYPVLFFFAGMLLYALRRYVPVDGTTACVLGAATLLLPQPNPLLYPALAYGVLAIAAARPLRRLRLRHDLSYGLYIYGAALQQLVGTLLPGRSAAANALVSFAVALGAAAVSWRCVEAPAIRFGRALVRRQGRFRRGRIGSSLETRPGVRGRRRRHDPEGSEGLQAVFGPTSPTDRAIPQCVEGAIERSR